MNRYDPFEEMDRMLDQFRARMWDARRPLGSDFDAPRGRSDANVDPTEREGVFGSSATEGSSLDLRKSDGEYVLVADLPGFETDEIDLTFEDGTLVIAAEHEVREDGSADETDVALRRSRRVAERVTLPEEIAVEDIDATYRNGVLEVHLPLVEEAGEDVTRIDVED